MYNTQLTYKQTDIAASTPDFPALHERWTRYIDAAPKTIETYTRALRPFFAWLTGNGITHPTADDIRAYRDNLKASRKPATVQAYMSALRQFFQYLEQENLYPNITEHIKGAKISKEHKKDYLTGEQVRAIENGIAGTSLQAKRDLAILDLLASCGLRTIEAARANVEDLRAAGSKTVLFVQGKGQEEKATPVIIPAETERIIREYLKERAKAGKICPSEPLFISLSNNSKGNRMTTRSISGTVKAAMIEAGYNSDRLTAHSLRHTFVTVSLLNGATLRQAQRAARHSDINTTTIYDDSLNDMENPCSALVSKAIHG